MLQLLHHILGICRTTSIQYIGNPTHDFALRAGSAQAVACVEGSSNSSSSSSSGCGSGSCSGSGSDSGSCSNSGSGTGNGSASTRTSTCTSTRTGTGIGTGTSTRTRNRIRDDMYQVLRAISVGTLSQQVDTGGLTTAR